MRPDLIEEDLITSADIKNSCKMFTQHLRKHKSEASGSLSLTIKKEKLVQTGAHLAAWLSLWV